MEKYEDSRLTIHERTMDLLSKMSVEEKTAQLRQDLYGWNAYSKTEKGVLTSASFDDYLNRVPGIGCLYGLFRADPWSKVNEENGILAQNSWKVSNLIQKKIMSKNRFNIPALLVEEAPHGHQGLESISYPTAIGRGATFSTQAIEENASHIATEMTGKGIQLALVSTLDLARDPRWGRTEECLTEDPFLAEQYTKATVKGFQGDLIQSDKSYLQKTTQEINKNPQNMGVVLKHLLGQGDVLGGHNSGTTILGQREVLDVYYPVIRGAKNAVGIMAAYNDIDGVPCHINKALLSGLLREKAGFQGMVMADGGALDRLLDLFETPELAAKYALEAGVDMSLWDDIYPHLDQAVQSELISLNQLNQSVYRVLSLKFLLGVFDRPLVEDPTVGYAETMQKLEDENLKIAEESIVLLKNDHFLPLKAETTQKIAVIGPNSDALYHQLGDYTAPQSAVRKTSTVFQGIKQHFKQATVLQAQGCEVRDKKQQAEKIEEAVELAKQAKVVVLALGGSSARNFNMKFLANGAVSSKGINMDSGENVDLADLRLGGEQEELFERISEVNENIILVLIQGRPHSLSQTMQEKAKAIICAWYPGQRGGEAIAHVISGLKNPSGKLAISYPRSSAQLPVYYYMRESQSKKDYYDLEGAPLFEFGYGLSYTQFEYSDLKISTEELTWGELSENKLKIEVRIKNIGSTKGTETALLFISKKGGEVLQRKKLLKGFEKVVLEANQEQRVTFFLGIEELEDVGIEREFIPHRGAVELQIANLTAHLKIK